MAKKRSKRISVLLIPDDNAEPFSFRLDFRVVRLLLVLALILVAHILVGAYSYYKLYETNESNRELIANNIELLEDNKRIYLLQEQVENVTREYQRVLGLLGVDQVNRSSLGMLADRGAGGRSNSASALSQDPAQRVQPDLESFVATSSFVSRKSTNLHDYTPNLPTLLPVEGYISAEFSPGSWLFSRGTATLGQKHPGIDIAGPRGTDILAAGSGTVVFAGWTSRYGNMVIINHGDNIFSYYAHNSKLLVSDRMFVRKGDPIAQLGNSGSTSKGPHLHFEIWKDGKPVNPREFIFAFHSDGS